MSYYFVPTLVSPSIIPAPPVAVAGSTAIIATCVFTSVIPSPGIIPAPSGIISPGVATSVVGVLP